MLSNKVARVAILVFCVFVDLSVTLKFNDTGVCRRLVNNIAGVFDRRKDVQHKSTTVHKSWKEKRRTGLQGPSNPNTVKEDVIIEDVCCNDYDYDKELDKCLPVCSMGCMGGECVDVDKCQCKPPLILVNHTCVQPVCSGCEHGECVAPGDCRCHAGYVALHVSCAPVCSSVCVNGRCAAPDQCECSPGHAPDPGDKFKCNPVCDPPCVNGTCVSYNKCICSVGYESTDDSAVCRPICAGCQHGQCVAPNQCICSDGYDRIDSTCKPKCSSCSNGDCIAPGICQCHKGYELKGEDCVPTCSPPCNNGQCHAPNQCLCNRGYNLTDTGCIPYCCQSRCAYGNCVTRIQHMRHGNKHKNSTQRSNRPFGNFKIDGMDGTWILIAAGGLLLLIIIIVMMQQLCPTRY